MERPARISAEPIGMLIRRCIASIGDGDGATDQNAEDETEQQTAGRHCGDVPGGHADTCEIATGPDFAAITPFPAIAAAFTQDAAWAGPVPSRSPVGMGGQEF